jgi:ketosteroid isomerase-like protein
MGMTDQMREGYARYSRRDLGLVDDLFAEDIRWNVPGPQGELHGRAAVRAFFDGLAETFSSHTIRLDDAVESGDRLICFVTHQFTRGGGDPVPVKAVHDWRFVDGQLASMDETADTVAFAIAAGWLPADALAQPA